MMVAGPLDEWDAEMAEESFRRYSKFRKIHNDFKHREKGIQAAPLNRLGLGWCAWVGVTGSRFEPTPPVWVIRSVFGDDPDHGPDRNRFPGFRVVLPDDAI